MFKQIKIENFRGITSLEMRDFRRVNLIVGENNCGKTTILESLHILMNPSDPRLILMGYKSRGFEEIGDFFWRLFFREGNVDLPIKMSRNLNRQQQEVREEMIIEPVMYSAKLTDIKTESAYSQQPSIITGLTQKFNFMKDGRFESYTSSVIVTDNQIKVTQPDEKNNELFFIVGGFYLTPHLIYDALEPKHASSFNRLLGKIQINKKTPHVVNVLNKIEKSLVDLSPGPDGRLYCDIGLDKLVPANIMGDGFLRILYLIMVMLENQNGVVLIDEIENGLYPSSQEILWDAIFKAAKEFNVQVFATTHSIECIMAFSSAYAKQSQADDDIRLYRIEKDGDKFRAVTYDHEVLEASLERKWEVR